MNIRILNARIVNEGSITSGDVLIKDQRIDKIGSDLSGTDSDKTVDAQGRYLIPGIIDDQVHFREPGLTHKADIFTESRAAVAGGITSFMEMPNTKPPVLTQELLEDKYRIAESTSLANYSFYMGCSNDNIEEVLKTDPESVCGIKVFMGSSTGDMLVDDQTALSNLFSRCSMLIASHCEDETTIRENTAKYRQEYGDNIPIELHPVIRSEDACYISSSFASDLAREHGTRLHILHISTAKEIGLFDNDIPLREKKVTSEACVHHMWFDDSLYPEKGTFIKWNPAIKTRNDRDAILQGVLDDKIDVIATDHAPHTREEKMNDYMHAPSGGPLVQHSLNVMMEFVKQGKITIERVVEKMCHNPAILFDVRERGYIREGYFADLVIVDPQDSWTVREENILAKCGWSPFEGQEFSSRVCQTFISGHLAYTDGKFDESKMGKRLEFDPR